MEWYCNTLALCVLVGLLKGTLTSEISTEPCPTDCQCNYQKVDCANMEQIWVSFLKVLPTDSQSVTIRDSQLKNMTLLDTDDIPLFSQMKYLRITNTNVTVIGPKAFRAFKDLIELHLDSDVIRQLDVNALHSLSSLQLLGLKRNVITQLHKGTFRATPELKVLDLSYNRIDVLYPTLFEHTDQLQLLNLTQNELSYLHPDTFTNLTHLHTVHLDENKLEMLHQDTFRNATSLTHVTLENNPWSCDCGLQWIRSENRTTHPLLRSLKTGLKCHTPPKLKSRLFYEIADHNFTCISPQITNELKDIPFHRLHTMVLECNATGYPPPSIYWITPRGVLAVSRNRKWMSTSIVRYQQRHDFIFAPTFHKSQLIAREDGSLMIHQIRHYFAGRYTCVAENPAGLSLASFNVSIKSVIPNQVHYSMFIGGATAACFLALSAIVLLVRQAVYNALKKRHLKTLAAIEDVEETRTGSRPPSAEDRYSPGYWPEEFISPYESPMKCTTPMEPASEQDTHEGRLRIRQTLEDARFQLRVGLERSVTRIRSGTQRVTESGRHAMSTLKSSSSHYMHTIRESGSTTIHNIRSSSSHISNRMRAGVVLGVEQVKYHVQSMRELCLTGNIGQTISTVSVATDIDSNEKCDVIKKVTYV